jgi:clan AA aspartic protease
MVLNTVRPFNNSANTEGTSLTGGREMGLVYADIELINSEDLMLKRRGLCADEDVRRVKARALVDTGAFELVISEDVARQLDLHVVEQRIVTLADDSHCSVDVVGPIDVRFENRRTIVRAYVLPGATQVLLGAIPLEGLDVMIDPRQQKLIVNPLYPDMASSIIKTIDLKYSNVYSR